MKTFLFQGDSITDANRDDENLINCGLGHGQVTSLRMFISVKMKR